MKLELQELKKIITASMLIKTEEEKEILDFHLTEEKLNFLYTNNFSSSLELARAMIFKDHDVLLKLKKEVKEQSEIIYNMDKAAVEVYKSIMKGDKYTILYTDRDFDGSGAGGSWNLIKQILPKNKSDKFLIIQAGTTGATKVGHGLNLPHLQQSLKRQNIKPEEVSLIVTADNAINNGPLYSKDEETGKKLRKTDIGEMQKIVNFFKNKTNIIVTDHHTPNETVVEETDNIMIVCSLYNPATQDKLFTKKDFYGNSNISGASVAGIMADKFLQILEERAPKIIKASGIALEKSLSVIAKINEITNDNDYVVQARAELMPTDKKTIEVSSKLGGLLNTNNYIGEYVTNTDLRELLTNSFDMDKQLAEDIFSSLNTLNFRAKNIIKLYYNSDNLEANEVSSKIINLSLIEKPNFISDFNYLAELRPLIILENAKSLVGTDYFDLIANEMENIFKSFQEIQKQIVNNVREAIDNGKDNTIEYKATEPESSISVLNVGRKLDAIIKNELATSFVARTAKKEVFIDENNIQYIDKDGILNKVTNIITPIGKYSVNKKGIITLEDGHKFQSHKAVTYVGSFRSKYSHKELFKNIIEVVQKNLGIRITIAGHDMAAGIKFEKIDKDGNLGIVSEADLELINKLINKSSIEITKQKEETETTEATVVSSTSLFSFYQKLNETLFSILPGREKIDFNVSFTMEEIEQMQKVGTDKYGWKLFKMGLDGSAFIIPANVLNKIKASGHPEKYAISFSTLGNSFIASSLRDVSNESIKLDKTAFISQMPELHEYISNMDEIKKGGGVYTEEISSEEIKESVHVFDLSEAGEEKMIANVSPIVSLLRDTKIPAQITFDVEANGLGMAMLYNFGANILQLEEETRKELSEVDFEQRTYHTADKKKVLIDEETNIKEISKEETMNLSSAEKLFVLTKRDKNNPKKIKYFLNIDKKEFSVIYNFHQLENGNYVYNEKLKSQNIAAFINESDILENENRAISLLTHIDTKWLKQYGASIENVDEIFSEILRKLVEKHPGQKILLQAHNILYDFNIVSQLPKSFKIIKENFIFLDSANAVREVSNKNVEVASINIIDPKNATKKKTIVFDNTPWAEGTLNYFLHNINSDNEGLSIVDVSGKYILEYKMGTIYMSTLETMEYNNIPLVENINEEDKNFIKEVLEVDDKYKKSAKYGIEYIDKQVLATNIVIGNKKITREDVDISGFNENEIIGIETFEAMLQKYLFTNTPRANIDNYITALGTDKKTGIDIIKEVLSNKLSELIEEYSKNDKILDTMQDSIFKKYLKTYNPKDHLKTVEKLYSDYLDLLNEKIINIYLVNNMDTYKYYSMIPMMAKILPELPPVSTITTEEIVLLADKFKISVKTMQEIVNNIKDFEEKWEVNLTDLNELHFNLSAKKFVNTDGEVSRFPGDTTLESFLVQQYLLIKMINPLSKKSANEELVAILTEQIILTGMKISKHLQKELPVNSYSTKQSAAFDRSCLDERIEGIRKDMDGIKISLSSPYTQPGTVINVNTPEDLTPSNISEKLDDTLEKINLVLFHKNVKNTEQALSNQLFKMIDNKMIFVLSKIFIDKEYYKTENGYSLKEEDIALSLTKRDNKDYIQNNTEQVMQLLLGVQRVNNNEERERQIESIEEMLKKIDFEEIKSSMKIIIKERGPRAAFTTENQISKMSEIANGSFTGKLKEYFVASDFIKSSTGLVSELQDELESEKYEIEVDEYTVKYKNKIRDYIYKLIAKIHYAASMDEYFNIDSFTIRNKDDLGFLSKEETEEFISELGIEIKTILDTLNSPISNLNINDLIENITSMFFTDSEEIKILQEKTKELDNNKKKFQNIIKTLLENTDKSIVIRKLIARKKDNKEKEIEINQIKN